MGQLASAVWLPTLLLLLLFWLPGCLPLRGPSTVTGTVGGSLSVPCQYEEEHKTNNKYWCRVSLLLRCTDIVKNRVSKEARKGRVSIRDDPANLTFTVTLENLALEDAGAYMCAVDIPLIGDSFFEISPTLGIDHYFKVVVSVVPVDPAEDPVLSPEPTPRTLSVSTSLTTESHTQGSTTDKDQDKVHEPQGLSLPVLLSVLALLLFLLVGTSLLTWRMYRKRLVKAEKHPELSQNLRQVRELPQEAAEESQSQYVNLQLHTWPLREEPESTSQVEVEYSTVELLQEELHYTSVVFDSQKQDSHANGVSPCLPQYQEPEYSVIQKPRKGLSDPHL